MNEHIQNIIFILDEALENEDWELVSEAKNLLENEEFEDFVDDDIYKKIYFLKEELTDLKEHTIKLTLQGNKMHQILNDKKKDDVSKIKELIFMHQKIVSYHLEMLRLLL